MNQRLSDYEMKKNNIRRRRATDFLIDDGDDEPLDDEIEKLIPERKVDLMSITKIGTGVLIGGGLGLLGGVAAIAVSASVAEIVIGGVVTKIAGVVGGAAGLGWGLHSVEKSKEKKLRLQELRKRNR